MKKKKINTGGIVYSTDKSFEIDGEEEFPEVAPEQQTIRIRLDKRQRAGKTVTLITGFELKPGSLTGLGKELKSACGTGGSAKDDEIIIQGDHREKVLQHLKQQGFLKSRIV